VDARAQILQQGWAPTRQKDGIVPENPIGLNRCEGGLRQLEVNLGLVDVRQQVSNDQFTLVIKHNALFSALLPELSEAAPVFGIVRNPLSVLASWNSVNLPVNAGRLPAGEMFCRDLQQRLSQTPDAIDRQLHILEWFCARFVQYLPSRILCYEDFVVDPDRVGQCLGIGSGVRAEFSVRASRNDSYELALMERLYHRLIEFGDAIWAFYSRDQVTALMDAIWDSK